MQRHVYGENHTNTNLASTLNDLCNVYLGLGDYNAARTNYKKALKMKRHVHGENAKNTDLARTLEFLVLWIVSWLTTKRPIRITKNQLKCQEYQLGRHTR
jgi:hypothetical protein